MSKTYYMTTGKDIRVVLGDDMTIETALEARNYTINFHPDRGYWLTKSDDFEIPKKLYGEPTERLERIFRTYDDRTSSTGVLLVGEKGSGKTLLSKLISVEARKRGMPTLYAMADYCCGPTFNQFIQSIDTQCVIVFDEFEKVFDENHQPHLLSLFDGVYNTKKLFVLTANDKYRVDSHLFNRPGRMYYYYEYAGLDEAFIRDYCEDNLVDKTKTNDFVNVSTLYDRFNFDTLAALVSEVNRFGEHPRAAMDHVNARPAVADQYWSVKVVDVATGHEFTFCSDTITSLDPFEFRRSLKYGDKMPSVKTLLGVKNDAEDVKFFDAVFTSAMLYKIDAKTKSFWYLDTNTGHAMVIQRTSYAYTKREYAFD